MKNLFELALPRGWVEVSVGEAGRLQLGRQRSPKHHNGTHMRPYLRVANVFEARIDTESVYEMNFSPEEFETYRLHAGDVLLNEGQSKELVGRPAIYRDEVPGACFTNSLIRFHSHDSVLPEWALAIFRLYLHLGVFQSVARWTTNIAHLSSHRLSGLPFRVPPPPEQQRIVDAIDSYLSRIDAAVASLERVQAKLKAYRASVLKAAVEGRLVTTEAELARKEKRAYEPADALLARILTERRRRWEEAELAKLKAAGKPPRDDKWKDKYEEPRPADPSQLPGLPKGWRWAIVDMLALVKGGVTKGQSRPSGEVLLDVPYLRVANVQRGYLDLTEVKTIQVTVSEGAELQLEAAMFSSTKAVIGTSSGVVGFGVARSTGAFTRITYFARAS